MNVASHSAACWAIRSDRRGVNTRLVCVLACRQSRPAIPQHLPHGDVDARAALELVDEYLPRTDPLRLESEAQSLVQRLASYIEGGRHSAAYAADAVGGDSSSPCWPTSRGSAPGAATRSTAGGCGRGVRVPPEPRCPAHGTLAA